MSTHQLISRLTPTGDIQCGHETGLARLDLTVLHNLFSYSTITSGAERWLIDLPEGERITFQTSHVEPAGEHGHIWYGDMPSCNGVQAIITVQDLDTDNPVVSGYVRAGMKVYMLTHVIRGWISIVCESAMHPRDCGTLHPAVSQDAVATTNPYQSLSSSFPALSSPAVISVLPVYGPGMIKKYNTGAIKGGCMTAQAYTNKAFSNSGIEARTLYLEPVYLDAIKVESLSEAIKVIGYLGKVGDVDDPMYKAVNAARENAKADIVVIMMADKDGATSGIATNIPEPPSYDHSELHNACFVVGVMHPDSFAHELGHLLGGKHDRATMMWAGGLTPAYDYACGYISVDAGNPGPFVTIMGYPNSVRRESVSAIPRIEAYSAADRQWSGKPLGVPMGQPDAADAATLFRQTAHVLAAYRGTEAEGRDLADLQPLQMTVKPAIGGAILPSLPGPYIRGTLVGVTATPRVGHRFSHWTLDNVVVPASESVVWVSMDGPHHLIASFVETGQRNTVTVRAWLGGPFAKDGPMKQIPSGEMVVVCDPPGPSYEPGSHIAVKVAIMLPDGSRHEHLCWGINNDIVPAMDWPDIDNGTSFVPIKIEKDVILDCFFKFEKK